VITELEVDYSDVPDFFDERVTAALLPHQEQSLMADPSHNQLSD
jgi:hypothetical protein